MKIELGKPYKRRDGVVTEPIRLDVFPFVDPATKFTYEPDGRNRIGEPTPYDLIEEYVEPVVVWCVLDNTGEIVKAVVRGLRDKRYLEQEWPGCRIVKLREVTDEDKV